MTAEPEIRPAPRPESEAPAAVPAAQEESAGVTVAEEASAGVTVAEEASAGVTVAEEASADASSGGPASTDVPAQNAAAADVAASAAAPAGVSASEAAPAGPVFRATGRVRPMPVSVVRAIGRAEPPNPGAVWPVLVPAVVRAVVRVPGALSVPRRPPPWPPIPEAPPRFLERPPVEVSPALPIRSPEGPADGPDPGPAAEPVATGLSPAPRDEAEVEAEVEEGPPEQRSVEAALEIPVLRAPVPGLSVERPELGRRGRAVEEGREVADPVRNRGFVRRLGERAALPVATAAVAAFVVGTGYLAVTDPRDPVSDVGRWGALAVTAPPASGANAGLGPALNPFGTSAAAATGAPSRLRVKAIGLDVTLEKLHLGADGVLVPPRGFAHAGWYADGTAPGDPGPAVIAGHVDSKSGPAVFYRLRELTAGDRIEVVRGGTVVRFTVTRTAWYPKTKFPTPLVYGPTPDRQLRLITCGGVFDHRLRSYKDNLVVYAVAG